MRKLFREGIEASVVSVVIIAIIEIMAARLGFTCSGSCPVTLAWHELFFKIGMIIVCIVPGFYYFMVRRDMRETIALFLTSLTLWMFGLVDVLYYWIRIQPIPYSLPWLNSSFVIGKISSLIGLTNVTSTSLILSVLVGLALVVFIDITLED